MQTRTIDLNDSTPSLDELLAQLDEDTQLLLLRDGKPLARMVASTQDAERILGLQAGQYQVSADFDDALPLHFWLGDDG